MWALGVGGGVGLIGIYILAGEGWGRGWGGGGWVRLMSGGGWAGVAGLVVVGLKMACWVGVGRPMVVVGMGSCVPWGWSI